MAALTVLRSGIHLRAMAQKQPKQEYKREAFGMFQELTQSLPMRALPLIWGHDPGLEDKDTTPHQVSPVLPGMI